MQARAKVLVVDDELANRRLLADLVAREGHEVRMAAGGAEALRLLETEPVDLVLLDLMMPDVDGMAVLAELQRRGRLPALPVVVVTAHYGREARIDALTAGAVDFLTKPIDRLEVTCKMRTLLELGRLRVQAQEQAAERATVALNERIRETLRGLPLVLYHGRAEAGASFELDWLVGDLERVVGVSVEAYRGGPYAFESVHPDDRPELRRVLADVLARRVSEWRLRYRLQHPTRGDVWVLNVGHSDASGRVVMGAILDISVERALEETLLHAQKMDAMGQLAGGVAHDFNNILAVILSYGTFVQEALSPGDERRDDIGEVLKAGEKAALLTRQLLAFSRQLPTEKRPVELNQCLTQLHRFLIRTLGEQITLVLHPANRPTTVRIDPVQFDQIIINLAVNARDAMPRGGKLTISIEPVPEGAGGEPGWVRLRVEDTGAGMDEATRKRIFEPFFTTKDKGKGTGLGLATCFGIVTDAGGRIEAVSAPGEGTVFIVELPLCADASVDGENELAPSLRPGRGETVLVAEDDASLRNVVARVLGNAGYRVEVAEDGEAAIQTLDALGPRLAVLVSDVVMPGRGGYDVAEHARRVCPHAAILMTSGFLDEDSRNASSTLPILWKPVAPSALVSAVDEALRERARARGGAGG